MADALDLVRDGLDADLHLLQLLPDALQQPENETLERIAGNTPCGTWQEPVLLSTTLAFAGADSFNRPHPGSSWVVVSGGLTISANHQLVGTANESLGYDTTFNTNTAATAVVELGGTDLEYGAVAVASPEATTRL